MRFSEIRKRAANTAHGRNFFAATGFFRSRYPSAETRCPIDGQGRAYFVTSEPDRFDGPRAYTIRRWEGETIETIGKFGGYANRRAAWRAIERLVK